MKWTIDKSFSFCYGHRVWSQLLETEYCERGDTKTKCRFLHGHEGLVHVYLENDSLERGMVTDFKHLGWLKNFLDDVIDHKFIIDYHDPHFEKTINGHITGQAKLENGHPIKNEFTTIEYLSLPRENGSQRYLPLVPITVPGVEGVFGYTIDTSASCSLGVTETSQYVEGAEKEFYDGFVIVDFVPTSENLCKWLFTIASQKMAKLGVKVSKLDWWETPKSRSSITAE